MSPLASISAWWATTIQKTRGNLVLSVTEDDDTDYTRVGISPKTLRRAKLYHGDIVWVLHKKHRNERMFIVCVDSTVSDDCASLGILARRNLSIEPGDEVHIRVCERIPTIAWIAIYPSVDTQQMAGCLFRDFLNPFFAEEPRPINEDDAITICRNSKVADFQVRWMGPDKHGIVGPGTIIEVQKHAIEQGDADGNQTRDLADMENPLEILKHLGTIIDHIPSNMHGSTIVDLARGFQRLEQLLEPAPEYSPLNSY